MTKAKLGLDERLPTSDERRAAAELSQVLATQTAPEEPVSLKILCADGELAEVSVPGALLNALLETLEHIGNGALLSQTPVAQRLTARQAAALLNVPWPYLTGLLKSGALAAEREGRRRYVATADLVTYRSGRDRQRALALDALAQLDADLL